ncbi:MAG: hypothetical protein V1775_18260 [Bacteroidota bacterium]
MKRFVLTSDAFTGEVEFIFNDLGLLYSFSMSNAQLSEKQQVFIIKELPRELNEIKRVIGTSQSAKITEVAIEITFEMFWKRYDPPANSKKKKKALPRWNKMSKAEQMKAYYHISKYESNMRGEAKMYAETYLNSELWNN